MKNNDEKNVKVVVKKTKKFFTDERKAAIKTGLKVIGVGFLGGCGTYLGMTVMSNVCTGVKSHVGKNK